MWSSESASSTAFRTSTLPGPGASAVRQVEAGPLEAVPAVGDESQQDVAGVGQDADVGERAGDVLGEPFGAEADRAAVADQDDCAGGVGGLDLVDGLEGA